MNQSAILSETFNLFSETGTAYRDATYDYSTRTLTLGPPTQYEENLFHYAVVGADFQSQEGHPLGGEYALAFTTCEDAPSASIDRMVPARGQRSVGLSAPIVVVYSGSSTHRFVSVQDLAGNRQGVDSTRFDPQSNSLTTFLSPLAPKTYYLVRVSDIATFDGVSDYMSYFITEDTQLPLVTRVTPDRGSWLVGLSDVISVTFNKPINVFTVDSLSFHVVGPHGLVPGAIEFGGTDVTTIGFTPAEPYLPATEYTVVMTPHIQDNLGNGIDSSSWEFTTGTFGRPGFTGGTVSVGSFELFLPQGALAVDTNVGLGAIPGEIAIIGFGGDTAVLAVDMEPSIALTRNAVLTATIRDSILGRLGSVQELRFHYYDAGADSWRDLGGTASGNRISLSISKLGRFGLFTGAAPTTASVDFASSVALIPRVINPRNAAAGGTSQLSVSYKLSQPTQVTAKIYSQSGRLIKTLESSYSSSVGDNLLQWDGRGNDGNYVDDGLYIVLVEAEGERVQKTFVVLSK